MILSVTIEHALESRLIGEEYFRPKVLSKPGWHHLSASMHKFYVKRGGGICVSTLQCAPEICISLLNVLCISSSYLISPHDLNQVTQPGAIWPLRAMAHFKGPQDFVK